MTAWRVPSGRRRPATGTGRSQAGSPAWASPVGLRRCDPMSSRSAVGPPSHRPTSIPIRHVDRSPADRYRGRRRVKDASAQHNPPPRPPYSRRSRATSPPGGSSSLVRLRHVELLGEEFGGVAVPFAPPANHVVTGAVETDPFGDHSTLLGATRLCE